MKELIKDKFKSKINNNFLDLISDIESKINDKHYIKTLDLWGSGNHEKNREKHDDGTDTHIEKLIEVFGSNNFKGNFLEIGCGEGIDLRYIKKNFKFNKIFAIDIGKNISDLIKIKYFKEIFFSRCDCLELPFQDDCFDIIYSYGVFHHTKNLNKAINESRRVLKKGGILIFYNYKTHKNSIKIVGTIIETILMKFFSLLSYPKIKIICYLLTPLILLIFSYPAQILKFFGSKKLYKSFPLWWGTHPQNIIYDLTDRLYAPVKIRVSKKEMETILSKLKFKDINVQNVRDGLFCKVLK